MINAFELITDIVQVINARPNKKKNSYYKVLDNRIGINGKIPLVRVSNHKTHCNTWIDDVNDIGSSIRFPANYFVSIVIENEPSTRDDIVPYNTRPFTIHEYIFKQEELEENDIHQIIQDVKAIFTTGDFPNTTKKGVYEPVVAKPQQSPLNKTATKQNITDNKQDTNMKTENRKRNMVRLTESKLTQIVAESVKKVLKEWDSDDDFVDHGYKTTSNWGGNEIQISDSGDAARLKFPNGRITDWLEIEFDEEGVAYVTTPDGDMERLDEYMRFR